MTTGVASHLPTVVVVTNLAGGGAQQVASSFAKYLYRTGNLRDFLLLNPRKRGGSTEDVGAHGVLGFLGSKLLYPLCLPVLAMRLFYLQPRVVFSTLAVANILTVIAARLSLRKKALIIIRETTTLGARSAHSGIRHRLVVAVVRKIYQHADAIIAPSLGVADDLVNNLHIPVALIHVLPNPTIDDEFNSRAEEPFDHPFLNREGAPVFVACGRLGPEKGFDVLLRAFALVRDITGKTATLLVLGEGSMRQELQALAHTLNIAEAVDFPGYVTNPLAVISKSDVFVLSSRWEGLPNALIQALGCGTTPVSTDCPSGPREILDGGEFGYLTPVDDVDAMASAMVDALQRPLPTAKLKARAQCFSSARIFAEYDDLVSSLIARVG